MSRRALGLAILACAALGTTGAWAGRAPPGAGHAPPMARAGAVPFVENRGQLDDGCAFATFGSDANVSFSRSGLCYGEAPGLRLEFVGADPSVDPVGADPLGTRVHSYAGDPGRWRTDLRTYGRLVYADLWPGVDLVYTSEPGRLKHEFVVRPGADPGAIRLRWRGATSVRVDESGAMLVETPAGELRDEAPYAYQDVGGSRRPVEASYALSAAPGEYAFRLGAHDPTRTLVIDPVQFVYATYLGSGWEDRGLGIAVDAKGSALVTGRIASGATHSYDAYVAKLTPDGTALAYFVFLGGEATDEGFDLAVDGQGAAYVAGVAGADDFPARVGPDTTWGGARDAYVAKLDPAGKLVWSTFVGGDGYDFAEGVAVDPAGNAYVVGPTTSTEATFPVTVGPDLTHNGGWDLFVAKVTADGKAFAYAGFVGGSADDVGVDDGGSVTAGHVGVDAHGAAYLSGMTESTEATFPTGAGFGTIASWDRTHNGATDAFAVKVKADGTGLAWAGYLGGDDDDAGFGMAVDREGNAFLTGQTKSAETTFPTGQGFGELAGVDRTYGGAMDGFVAKLAADGSKLLWCTYFGGPRLDYGQAVVLDPDGDLCVAGHAESPDLFVLGGPDLTFNGPVTDGDAFFGRIKADGTAWISSGFIGGAGDDHAFWVAVDAQGNAYVVGDTPSAEDTFPDGDGRGALPGFAKKHSGGGDAFVVKISK